LTYVKSPKKFQYAVFWGKAVKSLQIISINWIEKLDGVTMHSAFWQHINFIGIR
jgi:hypothetical protein